MRNCINDTLIMLSLFVLLSVPARMDAQVPAKMSYQAVIRNANNQLLINKTVGIQVSILHQNVEGEAVFKEIYDPLPQTNANGLVSLEIGSGESLTGSMGSIDWSDGNYFLKTEIDPDGGDNYSIVSVTQLLTVPYAFHAGTAENITGPLSETDPSWEGEANPEADIHRMGNVGIGTAEPTQKLDIDGQIRIRGGNPEVGKVLTSDENGNAFWEPGIKKYKIGDFAYGGIVFWVDETGEHGLVCAKTDQSSGIRWYAGTSGSTQAKGDGPLAGKLNTAIILAAHIAIGDDGSMYAARVCNALKITEGGFSYADWYLPSAEELKMMYTNRFKINETAIAQGGTAFSPSYYWSSTENYGAHAFYVSMGSGLTDSSTKSMTYSVRAVKSF